MGSVDLDCDIDFMCRSCKQFELVSGHILDRLLAVRLITHPMSVLDAASDTAYSTRAGAAAAAAADAGRFREFPRSLFENQPPEGGPALSDAPVCRAGLLAGISDRAFAETIHSGRYLPWPSYVTERATAPRYREHAQHLRKRHPNRCLPPGKGPEVPTPVHQARFGRGKCWCGVVGRLKRRTNDHPREDR